jgi:hypothetical protein
VDDYSSGTAYSGNAGHSDVSRDIDIQTRQSLNQPCTFSNAFAFGVYYVILCGLLVTRPRVPSMSLAMFAALRLSTFIGRSR